MSARGGQMMNDNDRFDAPTYVRVRFEMALALDRSRANGWSAG
jgi:hypothetical protein